VDRCCRCHSGDGFGGVNCDRGDVDSADSGAAGGDGEMPIDGVLPVDRTPCLALSNDQRSGTFRSSRMWRMTAANSSSSVGTEYGMRVWSTSKPIQS
jgi:hypothetical protein